MISGRNNEPYAYRAPRLPMICLQGLSRGCDMAQETDMAGDSIWTLSLDELKRMAAERLDPGAHHDHGMLNDALTAPDRDLQEEDEQLRKKLGLLQSAVRGTPLL